MLNIKKIKNKYVGLFLLKVAIICLPFTALPYNKNLFREASGEAAVYPLILLFFLYYISVYNSGKIIIYEKKWFNVVLFFFVIVILSLFVNYDYVQSSYYLGRSGFARYASQFLVLFFGFSVVFAVAYFIHSQNDFSELVRTINFCFFIVLFFGVFEFIAYELKGSFYAFYKYVIGFVSNEWKMKNIVKYFYGEYDLSSVSQEPAHLSIFYATMGPYFLVNTIRRKKILLFILYVFVAYLSYSRTMYYVLMIQFFVILYFFYFRRFNFKSFVVYTFLIVFIGGGIMYPIIEEVVTSVFTLEGGSNRGRYGGMYSALKAWKDNNIWFGVGLGQAGFYLPNYIPEWSSHLKLIYEEGRWMPIHSMLVRILVDCGIIGVLLWASIFLMMIQRVFNILYNLDDKNSIDFYNGLSSMTSLICLFVSMSATKENLTAMSMWVALGVSVSFIRINKKSYNADI